MSLDCVADQRDRADRLVDHILEDARVIDAERVRDDGTGRWAVEATLSKRCDGFPFDILYCLGFSVTVRRCDPQGDYWMALLLI